MRGLGLSTRLSGMSRLASTFLITGIVARMRWRGASTYTFGRAHAEPQRAQVSLRK